MYKLYNFWISYSFYVLPRTLSSELLHTEMLSVYS